MPLPENEAGFRALRNDFHFKYIPSIITEGPDHFESFKALVNRALTFEPVFINTHAGSDAMDTNERDEFYAKVVDFEKTLPVIVSHETHRGFPTFTPMATVGIIKKFPQLKLTADFSHWCCVCASLLEDRETLIDEVVPYVHHIHGRVGYRHGPQVPDPAAPEYAKELAAHERWWGKVIEQRKDTGLTFTPEYGPAFSRYLHTLPYTDQPVADIWEISLWAADRFCKQVKNY